MRINQMKEKERGEGRRSSGWFNIVFQSGVLLKEDEEEAITPHMQYSFEAALELFQGGYYYID